MRSFLVPATLVILGLAVIASAAFIPLRLDEAAMPEDPPIETALHAGSIGICFLGLSLASTCLLLGRRRYLLRHCPSASRLEARITTILAASSTGLVLLALAALAALLAAAAPALAISLGEMAEEAGQDLEIVPFFISVAFYILGVVFTGFGLIRLKRHVDHPSQTTIASGLVALLIGAALIAAPSVINSVGETFGVDPNATLTRPALE